MEPPSVPRRIVGFVRFEPRTANTIREPSGETAINVGTAIGDLNKVQPTLSASVRSWLVASGQM